MMVRQDGSRGDIILYSSPEGGIELDVRLEKESIWLTQKQMSLLFEKDTDTIGLHLRNIYREGELEELATTEDSSVVQQEGKRTVRRKVRLYNLDAVISVGYRTFSTVKWSSGRGTSMGDVTRLILLNKNIFEPSKKFMILCC